MPNRFLILGHRGSPKRFPENTLASFEETLRAGADGFETDLRLLFDRTPVLFHDDELREDLTDRLYTAFPSHPVAAYHRARLWIIDKERPAEAERLLLRYLSGPERRGGNASRAGAHWRLAQLYARQDRDAHAKEQYRLAAVLDPRLRSSRIPPGLEARL